MLLSDIHLGPVLRLRFCLDVLQAVEALQPFDAIVIVGDLVDAHVAHIGDVIPKCLARFPPPTFFVTGNHELFTGSLEAWLKALHTDAGFTVLENDCSTIADSLYVVGINELSSARHSPEAAADEAKAFAACKSSSNADDTPFLVLAHQPNHVPRVDEALRKYPGRSALIVSGHTHGGQVRLDDCCRFYVWRVCVAHILTAVLAHHAGRTVLQRVFRWLLSALANVASVCQVSIVAAARCCCRYLLSVLTVSRITAAARASGAHWRDSAHAQKLSCSISRLDPFRRIPMASALHNNETNEPGWHTHTVPNATGAHVQRKAILNILLAE